MHFTADKSFAMCRIATTTPQLARSDLSKAIILQYCKFYRPFLAFYFCYPSHNEAMSKYVIRKEDRIFLMHMFKKAALESAGGRSTVDADFGMGGLPPVSNEPRDYHDPVVADRRQLTAAYGIASPPVCYDYRVAEKCNLRSPRQHQSHS